MGRQNTQGKWQALSWIRIDRSDTGLRPTFAYGPRSSLSTRSKNDPQSQEGLYQSETAVALLSKSTDPPPGLASKDAIFRRACQQTSSRFLRE